MMFSRNLESFFFWIVDEVTGEKQRSKNGYNMETAVMQQRH